MYAQIVEPLRSSPFSFNSRHILHTAWVFFLFKFTYTSENRIAMMNLVSDCLAWNDSNQFPGNAHYIRMRNVI